jgi:hypothetical protein
MAHSFEYAVLTAVPNPRRGERVNVGIIVFRPDRVDVRFKGAEYKLRAITGENWDAHIESAEETLTGLYRPDSRPEDLLIEVRRSYPVFQPSGLGTMNVENDADYEVVIGQILKTLVNIPPRKQKSIKRTGINTEITKAFKQAKILASKNETIDDNKVVQDFVIDSKEGIVAPFALKNGKMIVASTLDLRKSSTGLEDSALSSIILDKARRRYIKEGIRTIGVFAVDPGMRENFSSLISLLEEYSDDLFDWSNQDENRKFKLTVYDALKVKGEWLFES